MAEGMSLALIKTKRKTKGHDSESGRKVLKPCHAGPMRMRAGECAGAGDVCSLP